LALQIGHNTAPSKNLSSRDPASRATSPSNSEKNASSHAGVTHFGLARFVNIRRALLN